MPTIRRASITFFTWDNDISCHVCRYILAKKQVNADIVQLSRSEELPVDFIELNPYGNLPTLVDKDLTLNEANVIAEYLDERFPHPPLYPAYPVARAKTRLMINRIQQDWYKNYEAILQTAEDSSERKVLLDNLINEIARLVPAFKQMPYFMSSEFSMGDCSMAPLLWRIRSLGGRFPAFAECIDEYADRIFQDDCFQASMTNKEMDLGEMYVTD
jgi:stringent starvation protein A